MNDANCLAMSEAADGAGRGYPVVFAVILGTGCGAGIVVNGYPLDGPNRIAGEWGHTPLPWMRAEEMPGTHCWCGNPNCLETYLSGPGLAMVCLGVKFKQAVVASVFISVFLPFGNVTPESLSAVSVLTATVIFVLKLLVIFVLASLYENSLARGRFLLTPRVTWSGFGVAALAFVFYFSKL